MDSLAVGFVCCFSIVFPSAKSYLISAVNSAEDISACLPDVLSCFAENHHGCTRWGGKKGLGGGESRSGENRWGWLMAGEVFFFSSSFIRIKLL